MRKSADVTGKFRNFRTSHSTVFRLLYLALLHGRRQYHYGDNLGDIFRRARQMSQAKVFAHPENFRCGRNPRTPTALDHTARVTLRVSGTPRPL